METIIDGGTLALNPVCDKCKPDGNYIYQCADCGTKYRASKYAQGFTFEDGSKVVKYWFIYLKNNEPNVITSPFGEKVKPIKEGESLQIQDKSL